MTQPRKRALHALIGTTMLAGALALPVACLADDGTHIGVAVTGGLSGFGADVGVNLTDYLAVRGTFAGYSLSHNGDYGTSVSWNATLKLFQAGALLDAYPFAGSFRLSAGLVQDGNKITLTGHPVGSTFTFNGNQYPSAAVPSVAASVDWSKTVPYLGLGWGNLSSGTGLHFTSDFGVLISGSPTASITVACNAGGFTGGAQNCSTLATDVAAEQAKLQNDVHKISVWPVVRFGIGWSF